MKKSLYFLLICFTGMLFSCTEDDIREISSESPKEFSDRAERFFLLHSASAEGKGNTNTGIVDEKFVEKLKAYNKKTGFICNLSDSKGLPIWQQALRSADSTNKRTENSDFIIIPLQ